MLVILWEHLYSFGGINCIPFCLFFTTEGWAGVDVILSPKQFQLMSHRDYEIYSSYHWAVTQLTQCLHSCSYLPDAMVGYVLRPRGHLNQFLDFWSNLWYRKTANNSKLNFILISNLNQQLMEDDDVKRFPEWCQ